MGRGYKNKEELQGCALQFFFIFILRLLPD